VVPFFPFMFLPSFCFLPSSFFSFSFSILFPFVSFLFLSFLSLFLSLPSSSVLKQPSPCQLSPRSPPVFYLICFLLCISSSLFQTIPSTFSLSLSLSLPFVLSLSGPLKKTLRCPLKNSLANRTPPFCSPHSGIYEGKRGESHPNLSNHAEWVRWLGSCPQGLSLFFNLRRPMGMGLVSFGFLGERGKEALHGRKSPSFLTCACPKEEGDVQCHSKRHRFPLSFNS